MKTLFVIIATLGFASSVVLADTVQGDTDSGQRYDTMFDQLDVDNSGNLNQDEASSAGITADDFQRLDRDGNGELSRDEIAAHANESDRGSGQGSDTYPSDGTTSDPDAGSVPGQSQ